MSEATTDDHEYLFAPDELADLTGEDRVTALAEEVFVHADGMEQLVQIIAQLADRVAHLELRVDQADIPYHGEWVSKPGETLSSMVQDLNGRVFKVAAR